MLKCDSSFLIIRHEHRLWAEAWVLFQPFLYLGRPGKNNCLCKPQYFHLENGSNVVTYLKVL